MVKLMLISPRKLFEQSFLAGTIFAVAALTLLVDLAIIALRGYAFNRACTAYVDSRRR